MAGHDRITPEGKEFYKRIEELARLQIRVGFSEGGIGFGKDGEPVQAEPDGPTVARIAAWNEMGTVNIPPRPFMRQSIDRNEDRMREMCKIQLAEIVSGRTETQEALSKIGALQVGFIQNEIRNGGFTPNAPSTIWKKSTKALRVVKDDEGNRKKLKNGKNMKRLVITKLSDRPLIDTGHMRQSVHYVIVEKGSVSE